MATPAQKKLVDLASSPSITGLPGLIFEMDKSGGILPLGNATVLHLLVDDPNSATANDRFMAGLRIGIWFQHGTWVMLQNLHMKRTDTKLFDLIQDSVRAEHPSVAEGHRYASRKLMAMFLAFERARIRFMKDAKHAQAPVVDYNLDSETAFLQPIDLWVDVFTGTKGGRHAARTFLENLDWVSDMRKARRFHMLIASQDVTLAPPPHVPIPDAPRNTRKRARTDNDVEDAVAPTGSVVHGIDAQITVLNSMRQEILQTNQQLAFYQDQATKLSKENTDLQLSHMITVGRYQQELHEASAKHDEVLVKRDEAMAKHDEALARINDLQKQMERMNLEAESSGMSAEEVRRRLKRVCEKWDATNEDLEATKEDLEATKKTLEATKNALEASKNDLEPTKEDLREAITHLQTYRTVTEAAEENSRAADEKARAAKDEADAANNGARAAKNEILAAQEEVRAAKEEARAAGDKAHAADEKARTADEKARAAKEKASSDRKLYIKFKKLVEAQEDRLKKELAAEKAKAQKLRDTIAKLSHPEKPKAG
ncbi:hypothetical protein F5X68DRAFT_195160 [Plectosphaerella plurivora]|uniref:Uncharacterized protein n=1 Tax=Plectosphaerella plurivora TaxID=936078 RepID=A0A9P8V1Z5_9PEZI|nr:hypothetical protein F5X68DRAFT_195160 [Plectosphaerella plurivora]